MPKRTRLVLSLQNKGFWAKQGGAEGWTESLVTPEGALEMRLLRRCTYAGWPFGEKEFVAMFEERFGLVWREWGFEKERQVRTMAG